MEEIKSQLKDIKGFAAIQIPNYLLWVVLGILALIIIAVLVKLYLASKNKESPKSLFEITVESLEKLKLEKSTEQCYLEYSEIVRTYLAQTFVMDLMDKTSQELKSELRKVEEISSPELRFLIDVLERADLAKFAKKEITEEQKVNDIEKSIVLVNNIEKRVQVTEDQLSKQDNDEAILQEELKTS